MPLNGNDLRAVASADRKRRLGHLIARAGVDCLKHSEAFADGARLLAKMHQAPARVERHLPLWPIDFMG